MYVLTVIDPNGDEQMIAETAEEVGKIVEACDWKSVQRIIVVRKA